MFKGLAPPIRGTRCKVCVFHLDKMRHICIDVYLFKALYIYTYEQLPELLATS